MAIEGSWRTYSGDAHLVRAQDRSLRLICAFDAWPRPAKTADRPLQVDGARQRQMLVGAFTLYRTQKMMAYRYSLNLAGSASASSAQINDMVATRDGGRNGSTRRSSWWPGGNETPEKPCIT